MKWIVYCVAALTAAPLTAADLNLDEARRIVIQAGGRKKPLDTFASESLQTISGRRTFRDPQTGQRLAAVDVLLSMWLAERDWSRTPVVLVPTANLRESLGLAATQRLFAFEAVMSRPALEELHGRIQEKRSSNRDLTPLENEAEALIGRLALLSDLVNGEAIRIVPDPKQAKGDWLPVSLAHHVYPAEQAAAIRSKMDQFAAAYRARDAAAFSAATAEFKAMLAALAPAFYPEQGAVNLEIHYNDFHPFRWAWIFYLGAFFVTLAPKARSVGLGVFGLGVGLHIYGFVLRCLIAGHAPVTNMYESVVWVSLGIAAFALFFDVIYRTRLYVLTAAPLAILGLIIADLLPSVLNPRIGPLPPVLRDNFWLVTHVLTITLGYSAFALAMGIGHVILAVDLFRPNAIGERSGYHDLLDRALQIGVLLLAAGTILGGVWANYSWGRFWGWDPKETWALIALLLYIFALHGRIAGWWGNFGLAVSAALCFNGVLMAWYGVNFVLGKGLHSYGFGGGGVTWIGSLVAADALFIGFCVWRRMRQLRQLRQAASAAQPARRAAMEPVR